MTREEAIKIAKGLRYDFKCDSELMVDFCNIVLDALQTEPCEDAISRQAVIDLVAANRTEVSWTNVIMYSPFYKGLIQLPPVQPKANAREPRIVVYSGDGYADGNIVYDFAECPNCGYEYEDGDKDWKEPFCPHCGQALKWEVEE